MNEDSDAISAVSVPARLLWGAGAAGIPLLCWRLLAEGWPALSSAWWFWLLSLIVGLLAVYVCPIPVTLWRGARALAYVETDAFRLSRPSMWTEVTHIPTSGAIEQMRLEDGNILSLSAVLRSVAVFVRRRAETMDDMVSLAEFPIEDSERRVQMSREERSKEDEALLLGLRKAIGWPKNVQELRDVLERHRDLTLVRPAQ